MKFGRILFTSASVSLALVSANDQQDKIANHFLRSADAESSEGRNLQISASYYGYYAAQDYWDNGKYKCLSDDVASFESSIRRKNICEKQYSNNKSFIAACHDGINAYIKEREDKCFASTDECEGFGETIADGVIATHCVLSSLKSSGRKW